LRLARDGNQWDLARGLEVVVGMAAAVGKLELALHVAGAAAALRDRMATPPWPSERATLDAAIACARQGLSEESGDVAWMRGWTSQLDQTLALAQDFLDSPTAQPPRSLSAASSGP
jgi:hypothetical protein